MMHGQQNIKYIVLCFLLGEAEENYNKPYSNQPLSGSRSEPGKLPKWSKSFTHMVTIFIEGFCDNFNACFDCTEGIFFL